MQFVKTVTSVKLGSRPSLELITQTPKFQNSKEEAKAPHVLCVPGGFHAAWCYDNFLEYFAKNGIIASAMSLRGHGKSEGISTKTTLDEHASDINALIAEKFPNKRPYIVAHSAGGGTTQRMLELYPGQDFPGVSLLGAYPPWGGAKGILRWLYKMPLVGLEAITYGRGNQYTYINSPERYKLSMFDPSAPLSIVEKHWKKLELNESSYWPSAMLFNFADPKNKKNEKIPKLIIGGSSDFIFPPFEMKQMGEAYNAETKIFEGFGHNLMLEEKWDDVAEYLVQWIKKLEENKK